MNYWKYISIAAAFGIAALVFLLVFRKPKAEEKKKTEPVKEDEPVSDVNPTWAASLGGGGGSFDVGNLFQAIPVPVTTYVAPPVRQVLTRVVGQPVRMARTVFRPATGTNTVTTPAGNSATIAANPNAPRFN